MKKRILVTGSSGFIGSWFLKYFESVYHFSRFSYLKDDLEVLCLDNIDVVVHCAAIVHQMKGAPEDLYQKVNVQYPFELAKKAKESGVRQFVFLSSIKVYGEEHSDAYNEDTPCHPQDPYGKSKLDAENLLLSLESTGFKVAILRIPVVYGEGVKANILKLLELTDRVPLLPFGGIYNKRSMVYVGNLVHMINEIIRQEKNGIFLAGDDYPVSTSELIQTIADKLEKKIWLFPCYLVKYALKWFKPLLYKRLYGSLYIDNTKSKIELNLQSPYTFDEGIKTTVTWYKDPKHQ